MTCEGFAGPCGKEGAEVVACRTQYADETQNTSPVLCQDCKDAYNEYWDGMWEEYYRGLL